MIISKTNLKTMKKIKGIESELTSDTQPIFF